MAVIVAEGGDRREGYSALSRAWMRSALPAEPSLCGTGEVRTQSLKARAQAALNQSGVSLLADVGTFELKPAPRSQS